MTRVELSACNIISSAILSLSLEVKPLILRLFPDSKTFVDMSLKREPELIREAFRELLDTKDRLQPPTIEDIR